LLAIESPVAVGGTAAGLDFAAAWQAVQVCAARNERELRRALWPAGKRRQVLRGWLAGALWGRWWPLEWAKAQVWLNAEVAAVPKFLPGTRKGKAPSGDWTVGMAARLMRMGMSETAAWWTPLALAAHYNVAAAEAEGREVLLQTEEMERELMELGWTAEDLG